MFSGIQQTVIDIITNGITTAAIALGFLLIFRGTGVFNVGYGALFIIAGYIFGGFFAIAGLPLEIAFAATAVLMAAIMALLDLGFRLIGGTGQHSVGDRTLIASIGLALIIEHACGLVFGTDVWSISTSQVALGYTVPPLVFLIGMSFLLFTTYSAFRTMARWMIFGVISLEACLIAIALWQNEMGILPKGRLIEALISLCCLLVFAIYSRSRHGLRWHAFLSSPATARLLGFNSKRYRLYCVLTAGAIMGLVSASRVMNAGVRPDESWRLLVGASFVALLAGRTAATLLAISGIIYVLVSYLAVMAFSSLWRDAISFSLLFLLLAFKFQTLDVETAPSEV